MIINLPQQDKNSKVSNLKIRLYFALLQDVDIDNFPNPVNSTILSNVLRSGKKHYFFDAKINTVNPTGAAGESQGNIALTLSPQIEGLSRQGLQFVYGINGERVIAFWENCVTGERFIAGSPCSGGLLVSVTSMGKMDDGFMGAILEMKGGDCPEPFYFYEGPILLDSPAIVPADSTTFAITDNHQYQLSDNTAATVLTGITGITDDEVGRIIELIGGGVNFPTVINPTAVFILRNGVAWTGTQGSKITFQIVKTGPAAYAFYEIHRS
jgi:hypothetical protein